MKVQDLSADAEVGVIVGRFQVPELHEAHRDLIQTVVDRHPRTIIFLGNAPIMGSYENPLDFDCRAQMIKEVFPEVTVLFIPDTRCDIAWSSNLDYLISGVVQPGRKVVLYGSRDSFIGGYHGRYDTQELVSEIHISGSEVRKQIRKENINSVDFRKGMIMCSSIQFPTVHPCVDVAIVDRSGDGAPRVLVAQKATDPKDKWRFIGGFADPEVSIGYENDAKREAREETGLSVSDLEYVGSYPVNDWRYRNERNKIITTFFIAKYTHGRAEPRDDLKGGKLWWAPYNELHKDLFLTDHQPLFLAMIDKLSVK